MNIIACLGNPGKKYLKTRHNIGFIIGEFITKKYKISMSQKSFSSFFGKGKIEGSECLIIAPNTYMNNSGTAIQKALKFYKLSTENLIVIHDEIELPFGEYKLKFGGGHKGHNGLRSIIQETGSPDFHSLRFGVGRPDNENIPVADYVLSNFTKEETTHLQDVFPDVTEVIVSLLQK